MTPLQGQSAPVAFPTFPMFQTELFDMGAAMRSPFAWSAPIWDFYAAAAKTNMAFWSAALSMRPDAMEAAFADAQKAMMQPFETMAAPTAESMAAPSLAEVQAVAAVPVKAAAKVIEKAVAKVDPPVRIEAAGEPEPAMVGGEAAPISPVAAAAPKTEI